MYADGSVRRLSDPADVQEAFHSFIALCARKQLDLQQEYEDQKRGKVASTST